MPLFSCQYCCCTEQEFHTPSEKLLLDHIRKVHSMEPNFVIQCLREDCARTFKNFRTFQNHLLTHRDQLPPEDETVIFPTGGSVSSSETSPAIPQESSLSVDSVQSYAAKWILETSEKQKLTRQAMLGIVQDTSFLFDSITQAICQQVTTVLAQMDVQLSVLPQVEKVFSSAITKPFEGLMSFHQQLQYYRRNFNFVVSGTVLHLTSLYCTLT